MSDALGHHVGPGTGSLGQDDRELLPPVTRGQIDLAHALPDEGGGAGEDPVSLHVAPAVVDALEIVEIEEGERGLELVALGAQDFLAQGLQEVAVVEQAGQAIGHRRALGARVAGDLDDLGVLELAVYVQEVVEQGHPQPGVAPESQAQLLPVALQTPPVALGLRLRKVQVGEDVEDRGVEGRAAGPVLIQLRQQLLLVGGTGLQGIE